MTAAETSTRPAAGSQAQASQATASQTGPAPVDKKRRKGLVMIWTGNGKGKTTAAMGLALRAAGNKMHVLFLQFIKGQWKTGEKEILSTVSPYLEHVVMGRGFTLEHLRNKNIPMEEHQQAASAAFRFAREQVRSGKYQMVILDEIMASIHAGFILVPDVLDLIREKPPLLHLVLTGRNAPPELVAAADLVSEVQPIKHPYDSGIPAQRGVEF